MKNRKILLTLLCLVMTISVAFGAAACSHTEHDYGASYKTSATQHWKECSCGEKSELGDHTFDEGTDVTPDTETENIITEFTCTVCGYKKTSSETALTNVELFDNFTSSLVNFENGSGYNFNFNLDVILGDGTVYINDENYNDIPYNVDIGASVSVELYVGKTNEGALDFKGAIKANINAYKVGTEELFSESDIGATFLLDGMKLYALAIEKIDYPTISEQLKDYNNEDYENAQIIDFEEILNSEEINSEFDALMIILPEVIDFAQEKVIPSLKASWDANAEEIVDFIFKSIESVYEITYDNGYTLSYDFDKIMAQNNLLYEKTISELYDLENGEGAFDALETQALAFMDVTVDDILNSIFKGEFTITALKNEVNSLLLLLYPEDTPTIEDLFGVDIFAALHNVELRSKTIMELICENSGMTKSEIKEQIENAFDSIRDVTAYDMLFDYIENSDDINLLIGQEQLKDVINKSIELIDSITDVKVSLDKKGAFKDAEIKFSLTDEDIINYAEYVYDLTYPEDTELLDEGDEEESPISLPYENIEAQGSAKLFIGKFANSLKIDFDNLKDKVSEIIETLPEYL